MFETKRTKLMLLSVDITSKIINIYKKIEFDIFCKREFQRNNELKSSSRNVCFLLGNGPSLKNVELDLIKDYDTFTVNDFYKYNTSFNSTFHIMIDPDYYNEKDFNKIEYICKNKKTNLILNSKFRKKLQNCGLVKDNIFFINIDRVQHNDYVNYDMCDCMTGSVNVMNVAIECAMYMGYKKIYLLGCDFNSYAIQKQEHFYVDNENDENIYNEDIIGHLLVAALCQKHHFALEKASRKIGVKIINLTEGSLISAYRKDKLSNVLK